MPRVQIINGDTEMKVAIVGSRGLNVTDFGKYLPEECDEIVSGGARGIDSCAEEYARKKGLKVKVFLPEYEKYGRVAPLKRNDQIAEYADEAIAFWDGESRGTAYTIRRFQSLGKKVRVFKSVKRLGGLINTWKE